MGIIEIVRRLTNGSAPRPQAASGTQTGTAGLNGVLEVTALQLLAERAGGAAPVLLDCREESERAQGHIPGSLHMAMGGIPARLGELEPGADLVVVCAHGNRSLRVAGYLVENGFRARSLRGGIVDWQNSGGEMSPGSVRFI